MARRRRVEVDLRVGRPLGAVRAQHVLEVADAHVVGDERQVVAAQLLARDRQVAGAAGQRLDRVEALVDRAPLRAAAPAPSAAARAGTPGRSGGSAARCARRRPASRAGCRRSRRGSASAPRRPRCRPPSRPRAPRSRGTRAPRAGPARAGAARRRLDLRAPARDALGGRRRAAGRARVEHVARAGRRALDERLLVVGVVGERIGHGRAAGLAAGGRRHELHARGGPVAAQRRAGERGDDQPERPRAGRRGRAR